MNNLDFKVYGDTPEERDRVLAFIDGDPAEVNLDYCKKFDKFFKNRSHTSEDRIVLSEENLDGTIRIVTHVLNKAVIS